MNSSSQSQRIVSMCNVYAASSPRHRVKKLSSPTRCFLTWAVMSSATVTECNGGERAHAPSVGPTKTVEKKWLPAQPVSSRVLAHWRSGRHRVVHVTRFPYFVSSLLLNSHATSPKCWFGNLINAMETSLPGALGLTSKRWGLALFIRGREFMT